MILGGGTNIRTCKQGGHPTTISHHCEVEGCPSNIDNCPNKENHLRAREIMNKGASGPIGS